MTNADRVRSRSGKLEVDDLAIEHAFADRPLDEVTLRCLRYMHDVESHTVCYLRDVLVTKAHADPVLTEFLTTWAYEEHWHGDALGRVLMAHAEQAGPARIAHVRAARARADRLRPLAFMVGSAALPDITATHMAWGAINEWTTQAGYARLGANADHPVLSELLGRIMRQEGRHIDFYAGEARRRLERSVVAQRITRFALKHVWRPVGTGVRPTTEVNFVIASLFQGDAGEMTADRIDRRVDQLPGLSGLNLIAGARRTAFVG